MLESWKAGPGAVQVGTWHESKGSRDSRYYDVPYPCTCRTRVLRCDDQRGVVNIKRSKRRGHLNKVKKYLCGFYASISRATKRNIKRISQEYPHTRRVCICMRLFYFFSLLNLCYWRVSVSDDPGKVHLPTTFFSIICGDWLARGYMPAHQHCDLF